MSRKELASVPKRRSLSEGAEVSNCGPVHDGGRRLPATQRAREQSVRAPDSPIKFVMCVMATRGPRLSPSRHNKDEVTIPLELTAITREMMYFAPNTLIGHSKRVIPRQSAECWRCHEYMERRRVRSIVGVEGRDALDQASGYPG